MTERRAQLELALPAAPVVRALAGGGAVRAVRLGHRVLTYRFERARRRTIGIFVDRHGLGARAPRWVPLVEVEAFIREKEQWILAKLAEIPAREHAAPMQWHDGAQVKWLGTELAITFDANVTSPVVDGNLLRTPASSASTLRARVIAWLAARATELFRDRAGTLAPKIEVATPFVSLTTARTQWGSCTVTRAGQARIRLHWRLIHMPRPLIDYVVAHELAHIREMNHSPRFWRLVECMIPDYRDARKELRRLADQLPEL